MQTKENIKFREEIIKKQFKESLGYELNLENPRTFNEKLQWLKLYYHNPLMTKCADKYLAREYIKEKIGEEYLIPLIGVWDKVEDIDFNSLPEQFVLKVNWGSGMNIVVKDKSKLDVEDAKNQLKKWINPFSNHYYYSFEYSYKYIEPKIICEKYIEQIDGDLFDYKLTCFNGKVIYIELHINSSLKNHKRCFYSLDWIKQDFTMQAFPTYKHEIPKPIVLDELIKLANILSAEFPNVRVDFYILNNHIYFGELTFYDGAGFNLFIPQSYDYKFGELLELPKEKIIEYDFVDRETLLKQSCNLEFMVKDYRDLEYNFNSLSDNFNLLSNSFNLLKNREYKNDKIEKLRLNCNWWTLFGISNNSEYLRLTLFGIKLSFKMNKEKVDKLAWWIPFKKLRENFRNKFRSYYD